MTVEVPTEPPREARAGSRVSCHPGGREAGRACCQKRAGPGWAALPALVVSGLPILAGQRASCARQLGGTPAAFAGKSCPWCRVAGLVCDVFRAGWLECQALAIDELGGTTSRRLD